MGADCGRSRKIAEALIRIRLPSIGDPADAGEQIRHLRAQRVTPQKREHSDRLIPYGSPNNHAVVWRFLVATSWDEDPHAGPTIRFACPCPRSGSQSWNLSERTGRSGAQRRMSSRDRLIGPWLSSRKFAPTLLVHENYRKER